MKRLLFGFVITLIFGGLLYSYGPLAIKWDVTPARGEVSIVEGIIIPTAATGVVGAIIALWLGRLRRKGKRSFARGFLVGAVLFFLAAFLLVFTPPFWSSVLVSLLLLPGAFVSDTLVNPLLTSARPENYLIIQSREPLITWVDVTVSWFVWSLMGAIMGQLASKKAK